MKKITLLLLLFIQLKVQAQVQVFCDLKLNGNDAKNSTVTIFEKDKLIQTIKTQSKSTFSVELKIGSEFKIYIDQPEAFRTYFIVETNKIPQKINNFSFGVNLDAILISKYADNIDSTAFLQPCSKIIYNARKRMVEDFDYTSSFQKTIYKVR